MMVNSKLGEEMRKDVIIISPARDKEKSDSPTGIKPSDIPQLRSDPLPTEKDSWHAMP